MSHSYEFHFTIGPVQGFVAQARRTRDFWAGSFLLSYLSGVAMAATRNLAGEDAIRFPKPDPNFLHAIIEGESRSGEPLPSQGSVPNRFKAIVPEGFDGSKVVSAVKAAWQGLANVIWQKDLSKFNDTMTQFIWDEQIRHFWEISWVVTKEGQSSLPVLDMRKNWRTYLPTPQEGRKCSLMEGWQELSGHLSPDKNARETFWQQVQQNIDTLDIQKGESLCAMAFIKRRFVHYFPSFRVESALPNLTFHGWEIPKSVPSVALLAAEPVIKELAQAENETVITNLQSFKNAWNSCGGKHGEKNSLPASIRNVSIQGSVDLSLDGIAWHPLVYDNAKAYGLSASKARDAKHALKSLYNSASVQAPSPFYAVLMMDGDSLGKQMSAESKQQGISEALSQFTQGVSPIVDNHNGFLIYAGGDDVLALLPMESAISCAIDIREHYNDSFRSVNSKQVGEAQQIETSISAAILYNHIKTPLTKILHEAHDVLDNHAKEGAGRDAIAIRVTKQSGVNLDWAQPWQHALTDDQTSIYLQQMAEQLFSLSDSGSLEASHSFLYQIRSHTNRLVADASIYDSALSELLSDLIAVDYVNSGINRVNSIQSAKVRTERLLQQCTPHRRVESGGEFHISPQGTLSIDGALLALFLATKGHSMAGES